MVITNPVIIRFHIIITSYNVINMVNAIVRNAKAKTIERRFLDFKNNISKLFTTYIGGNVIERPEILKVMEACDEGLSVKYTQVITPLRASIKAVKYNLN